MVLKVAAYHQSELCPELVAGACCQVAPSLADQWDALLPASQLMLISGAAASNVPIPMFLS